MSAAPRARAPTGLGDGVVVVTGAASGIGAATTRLLLEAGARVLAMDRDGDRIDQVFADAPEARLLRFGGDVARVAPVADSIDRCCEEWGRLDGYVAGAAIAGGGTVEEISPAAWDEVLSVNLRSVYLGAHFALPRMRESGGGSFVAVSSQFGVVGVRGNASYCAAKGGVVTLVKAMALDAAPDGIRVNCVCPGPVDTPLLHEGFRHTVDTAEAALARVPLERFGTPEEIASAILFLLSPAASFVTGAAMLVDGGASAH